MASRATSSRAESKARAAFATLRAEAHGFDKIDARAVDELLGALAVAERGLLELRRRAAGQPAVRSHVDVPDFVMPEGEDLASMISRCWFESGGAR